MVARRPLPLAARPRQRRELHAAELPTDYFLHSAASGWTAARRTLPLAAQPRQRHANAATVDEGPWPISYRRPTAARSGRRCLGVVPHANGVTSTFALAR